MDTPSQPTNQFTVRILQLSFLLLLCYSTLAKAVPIVDVRIEGIEGDLLQNVNQVLSIVKQREHQLLSVGRIHRLHEKADDEIRTALQPYGYYRASIEKSLRQIGDDRWQAVYNIDAGSALRINAVNLQLTGEAGDNEDIKKLFDEFPLKPGDRLNQVEYENAKSYIIQAATELGYFEYSFSEHRITIDLENYYALITLEFDSGPRYRFGTITYAQNVLEESLLRRYLPFAEGEPYSVNRLIELQRALSNSDYFQSIDINPDTTINPDHTVPVTISLTPRKPNKYTLGLGYGTDTQARGKIGWSVPRVNRYGHHFDSEIRASRISKSISANYRIPVGDPTSEELAYSAAVTETTTNTSESLIRNLGVSLTQTPYRWRQILSLNYQFEGFTVADERDEIVLLIPGVNWSRAWADDISHVRRGIRIELGLRGASESFASEISFFQAIGSGKLITSITTKDRIILRGKVGHTATEHFDQLPASLRFFAGGSQSVRGYSYESLGPRNDQGDVVGGRYLLVGSAELEHSLTTNWAAALFYDAGNAIDDMTDSLRRGTGLGVRWKTPIGPVSFDIAWPISTDGKRRLLKRRFHINIGPDL